MNTGLTTAPDNLASELEIVGTMNGRTTKVWQAYQDHKRTHMVDRCPFCGYATIPVEDRIEEAGTMVVIRNAFPYAAWDSNTVEDHLMVVPARHLLSFADFTDEEAMDHFRVARAHEARGYSVYTRSQSNTSRSVGHLHTHLIRTGARYGH